MKIVNKYQADDGTTFDLFADCLTYETICKQVNDIMKDLKPIPKDDNCNFANGGGYIQQDKEVFQLAKAHIFTLANSTLKSVDTPISWEMLGRYLDDSNINCLYRAWKRLHCIDSEYKEWGQTYFATFVNTGKQIEL